MDKVLTEVYKLFQESWIAPDQGFLVFRHMFNYFMYFLYVCILSVNKLRLLF